MAGNGDPHPSETNPLGHDWWPVTSKRKKKEKKEKKELRKKIIKKVMTPLLTVR